MNELFSLDMNENGIAKEVKKIKSQGRHGCTNFYSKVNERRCLGRSQI